MTRADRAFAALGHVGYLDGGGKGARVELPGVGHVEKVHVRVFAESRVFLRPPRVALEVLAGAELHRVDEDRNDDEVAGLARLADEGKVAFVERAHGWSAADHLVLLARGRDEAPNQGDFARLFHRLRLAFRRRRKLTSFLARPRKRGRAPARDRPRRT